MFESRYKSCLVKEDAYFLQTSRYIHLNPVKRRWQIISKIIYGVGLSDNDRIGDDVDHRKKEDTAYFPKTVFINTELVKI